MKNLIFVLLLSFGSPLLAQAAETPATRCRVLIPSDPIKEPNSYDKSILELEALPDGKTHYLLLNKDRTQGEEISADAYFAHKARSFRDIEGHYVVFVMRSEGDVTTVLYGKADAEAVKVNGGATAIAVKEERLIVSPEGSGFGIVCHTGNK